MISFEKNLAVGVTCRCRGAAGGQGVVQRCERVGRTRRWEEKIGEKAIKPYLSPGIFMTGSYEEMCVRATRCSNH